MLQNKCWCLGVLVFCVTATCSKLFLTIYGIVYQAARKPRMLNCGTVPPYPPPAAVEQPCRFMLCTFLEARHGHECSLDLPRFPCFLFAVLPLQLRTQTQMTAERRGRVTVSEEAAEAALLSSRVEDLLEAVSRRSAVAFKSRGAILV